MELAAGGNINIKNNDNVNMEQDLDLKSYYDNIKNEYSAIESTSRFKYIRQLEALYESTPQAILQLVYLMRTGEFLDPIVIISILQSIISMTNSMLNADSSYMVRDKFSKYKKKFPPSIEFISHLLLRLSEITYRIMLAAIFWTVVGGLPFGIVFGFECLLVVIWVGWQYAFLDGTIDSIFLALNQVRSFVSFCVFCDHSLQTSNKH